MHKSMALSVGETQIKITFFNRYHHGFDHVYEDAQVLRRLAKLEQLRKRGKGPPKKGQGRRASRKKK
jgi:hypothetical protein